MLKLKMVLMTEDRTPTIAGDHCRKGEDFTFMLLGADINGQFASHSPIIVAPLGVLVTDTYQRHRKAIEGPPVRAPGVSIFLPQTPRHLGVAAS